MPGCLQLVTRTANPRSEEAVPGWCWSHRVVLGSPGELVGADARFTRRRSTAWVQAELAQPFGVSFRGLPGWHVGQRPGGLPVVGVGAGAKDLRGPVEVRSEVSAWRVGPSVKVRVSKSRSARDSRSLRQEEG
jgi:hypothetical protein